MLDNLLALAVLAAAPQVAADKPQTSQSPEVSPHEIEALEKVRALRADTPNPPPRTQADRIKFIAEVFDRMAAFEQEWPGTAAAIEARHVMAAFEIRFLERRAEGVKKLEDVYRALLQYQGPPPPDFRLSADGVAFDLALELITDEDFDRAEKILGEVAAMDSPLAERARVGLEEMPIRRQLANGNPIPPFQLRDLNDAPVGPEDYLGKVWVLDFWATWCGPWRFDMPKIRDVYNEFYKEGFDILGISLDEPDKRDMLVNYLNTERLPWRQVYEGNKWSTTLAEQFAIHSIPSNFIIDRKGIIRRKNVPLKELREAVDAILADDRETEEANGD